MGTKDGNLSQAVSSLHTNTLPRYLHSIVGCSTATTTWTESRYCSTSSDQDELFLVTQGGGKPYILTPPVTVSNFVR